ncbi:G-protein coupled receptors family 1 profile domain-containing protein [Caenorhabditis elegans]|uniref:G-protein coupled receptors family 1 profile domain-containing protein n=1 Tax=Caenorhabditis elegans TaxID=6239 RepID=Q7JNX1_CAEEL|nr:G-protein coupled receptors family 1 profile domain-containing protein [Caenorhabditis elegans]CCD83384.1 G-protein coupled receptors family 1 profile domain-containing protein [Caenorhabditis elegans]|eukprot:NP_001024525.1 NMUR (NeuroMedin U Receptor) homolog [Caenorhabditis elegans]
MTHDNEYQSALVFDRIRRLILNNSNTPITTKELIKHCFHPDVQFLAHMTLKSLDHPGEQFNNSSNQLLLDRAFLNPILTLIFVFVGLVGLIGNLLTVIVIFKTNSLHSHTNYFLANLATSDFCLIVVGVSFDLVNIWNDEEPLDIFGYCSLTSTFISLFTFASILTIVLLTAERFTAICYPFSHRTIFDEKRVKRFILLIWFVALLPSIFIGSMFKRVSQDFCGFNRQMTYIGRCDLVTSPDSFFRYPFESAITITFVLPLFFIIYCYFRILVTLNEMSNSTHVHTPVGTARSDSGAFPFPHTSNNSNTQSFPLTVHTKNVQPPRSQQAQKMVIKMLVTVTAVFFVCYLPYHAQRLIVKYNSKDCSNSDFCKLLYPIAGILQYISASLNPIFYNLMSVRFRNGFKKLIKDVWAHRARSYSNLARV